MAFDVPILPRINDAIKSSLRGSVVVGYIKNVDPKRMLCNVIVPGEKRAENLIKNIKIDQPLASVGWGIFGIPTDGTAVRLLKDGKYFRIIGYETIPAFLPSVGIELPPTGNFIPSLDPGEIAVQSKAGALIKLFQKGAIQLATPKSIEIMMNELYQALGIRTSQYYMNTDAFMLTSGAVLRDARKEGEIINVDGSWDPTFDEILEEIGYNPSLLTSRRSFVLNNKQIQRNPAFAEMRLRIKEFANSYIDYLKDQLKKNEAITDNYVVDDNTLICDTREWATILGPNDLGEIILGTVVNTLGKVIDIDGDIIDIRNEKLTPEDKKNLNTAGMAYIKFNSRGDKNGLSKRKAVQLQRDKGTKYEESKWYLGVSKEGLTKINIPSSSVDTQRNKVQINRSLLFNADGSVEATVGTASGKDKTGVQKDALPIMEIILGGVYDEKGELKKTKDIKSTETQVQNTTTISNIKDTEIYAQIRLISGTVLNIDKNGSVQLVVNKDIDLKIVKNKSEIIGGNVDTYIGGEVKEQVAKTVENKFNDKLIETVKGNVVQEFKKNEEKKVGENGILEYGKDVIIKAGKYASITGSRVNLGSKTAVQALVLGNSFMAYLNTHVHGSAMGPTTPPVVPMTPAYLSKTVYTV